MNVFTIFPRGSSWWVPARNCGGENTRRLVCKSRRVQKQEPLSGKTRAELAQRGSSKFLPTPNEKLVNPLPSASSTFVFARSAMAAAQARVWTYELVFSFSRYCGGLRRRTAATSTNVDWLQHPAHDCDDFCATSLRVIVAFRCLLTGWSFVTAAFVRSTHKHAALHGVLNSSHCQLSKSD